MIAITQCLTHVLLRIPRMKRWHDNLVNEGTVGIFPTPGKLLRQLWKDLWAVVRMRMRSITLFSEGVGVFVRTGRLPQIKLSRKFIITLVDMPLSMQSAQRCIESASRHGEGRHLEIMPAIDKFHSEEVFRKHGLIWDTEYSAVTNSFAGMGCFASHYKLWSYCVEAGTPLVVLEHDVEFIRPIPSLRFRDVIVLAEGGKRPFILDSLLSSTQEAVYVGSHLYGTHAYAITPEGAQKLMEQARRQFLPPADWFIHKRHIDVIACREPPLQLVSRFSSIATWNKDVHAPKVYGK